jgi:hypothetical protein
VYPPLSGSTLYEIYTIIHPSATENIQHLIHEDVGQLRAAPPIRHVSDLHLPATIPSLPNNHDDDTLPRSIAIYTTQMY